jgi:Fuc2NAc and GlcNAc transferase
MIETALVSLAAFLAAWLLTAWVRRAALRDGVLDVPNQRSSHKAPTPRGGGLSIVVALSLAAVYLRARGLVGTPMLVSLLMGGYAIAAVGYFDDRRPVSPLVRLLVHLGAATLAVWQMGGLPAVQVGAALYDLGWVGHVVAVLGLVWVLNLFNFMDGIDGIAGVEAVCVFAGAALLMPAAGGVTELAWTAAACSAGFLAWNWPPAKIFMGDVGSGYLGYTLGVLALAFAHQEPVGVWVFLVLGGVFVVDATLTLFRRLARGERVYEAHRSHAYQHLAQRWGGHRPVTLGVLLLNLCWLLPWALVVTRMPSRAGWCTVLALLPLAILALLAGAGRASDAPRQN